MKRMVMLDTALAIVASEFEGKFDKGGYPYMMHCLHVMYQMDQTDEDLMVIAVMHDLIEDTPWVSAQLVQRGFSSRVVTALMALTHAKSEPYMDYIKRVATNSDARLVKLADLQHNSMLTRLRGLTKKDHDRMEKYCTAYTYLKEV